MADISGLTFIENVERKLELVDGRLITGHALANGQVLLELLLRQVTAREALKIAPRDVWLRAFQVQDRPAIKPSLVTMRSWRTHYDLLMELSMALFQVVEPIGYSLSRDCVMRLGNDGFTPDVYVITGEAVNRQLEYYLDGPATLVVEIVMSVMPFEDLKLKRYMKAGVPEVWRVDPFSRTVEIFVRQDDSNRRSLMSEGQYVSAAVPGLILHVSRLWDAPRQPLQNPLVELETAATMPKVKFSKEGLKYGGLPFAPRVALEPVPITFEEYIAWTPEAKFELLSGRLVIGSDEGTLHVFGLLVMTFGLTTAATLAPDALKQAIAGS